MRSSTKASIRPPCLSVSLPVLLEEGPDLSVELLGSLDVAEVRPFCHISVASARYSSVCRLSRTIALTFRPWRAIFSERSGTTCAPSVWRESSPKRPSPTSWACTAPTSARSRGETGTSACARSSAWPIASAWSPSPFCSPGPPSDRRPRRSAAEGDRPADGVADGQSGRGEPATGRPRPDESAHVFRAARTKDGTRPRSIKLTI
jgi:hypothetical protein